MAMQKTKKRDKGAFKTLFKAVQRRKMPIDPPEDGVLSVSQALAVFDWLKGMDDLHHEYATDLCYARAELMCNRLKQADLPSQKIWAFATHQDQPLTVSMGGGQNLHWDYHVAPVLKVRDKNGVCDMVFDPALMDGPATRDEWSNTQNAFKRNVHITPYGKPGPKGTREGYAPSTAKQFDAHPLVDARHKIDKRDLSKSVSLTPRDTNLRLKEERRLQRISAHKAKQAKNQR